MLLRKFMRPFASFSSTFPASTSAHFATATFNSSAEFRGQSRNKKSGNSSSEKEKSKEAPARGMSNREKMILRWEQDYGISGTEGWDWYSYKKRVKLTKANANMYDVYPYEYAETETPVFKLRSSSFSPSSSPGILSRLSQFINFVLRNWAYGALIIGGSVLAFYTCTSPYTNRFHVALLSPEQERAIERSYLELLDRYRPAQMQWIPLLPFTPEGHATSERIFNSLVQAIDPKILSEHPGGPLELKLKLIDAGQWTASGLPAGTIVLHSGRSFCQCLDPLSVLTIR